VRLAAAAALVPALICCAGDPLTGGRMDAESSDAEIADAPYDAQCRRDFESYDADFENGMCNDAAGALWRLHQVAADCYKALGCFEHEAQHRCESDCNQAFLDCVSGRQLCEPPPPLCNTMRSDCLSACTRPESECSN
jgi:hypothetical protein